MRASLIAAARTQRSRVEKLRTLLQRRLTWRDVLESARAARMAEIAALAALDDPSTRDRERRQSLEDEVSVIDRGGNRWDRGFLSTVAEAHGMVPPPGSRDVLDGLFGLKHTRKKIDDVTEEIAAIDERLSASA